MGLVLFWRTISSLSIYQFRQRTDVRSVDVQTLHKNKLPGHSGFTRILPQKETMLFYKTWIQIGNRISRIRVAAQTQWATFASIQTQREISRPKAPELTFWSSSSCSLSSLSRSSMLLCLKYLMKLRDAWRPFWMEKQAASSLNIQQAMFTYDPISVSLPFNGGGGAPHYTDTHTQHLHKDDVPPLGVGRDGTGNGRKAVRIDNGFFCFHEFGQTTLQLQVNIWRTEIRQFKLTNTPALTFTHILPTESQKSWIHPSEAQCWLCRLHLADANVLILIESADFMLGLLHGAGVTAYRPG